MHAVPDSPPKHALSAPHRRDAATAPATRSEGRRPANVSSSRRVAPTLVALIGWFATQGAHAQEDDAVYRRLDTDATLALGVGAGAVLGNDASEGNAAGAAVVEARLRILDAAGPVLAYRWSHAAGGHLAVGVEVRPLWPMLWLIDKPTRVEWVDLLVQSLGVELAAVLLPLGQPSDVDVNPGVALSVGVAFEIPLVVPSRVRGVSRGVFLRLAARRIDATRRFRSTSADRDLSEWSLNATLQITLGLDVGADAEPPRYRLRR